MMRKKHYKSLELNIHNSGYLVFLCGVLTLLLISISQPAYSEGQYYSLSNPPGELLSVGTHRLHINCKGAGTPTVIIDSGMGGFSLEWQHIHETLSNQVRVCTYDRAGYGWSEVGPSPRTSSQIASELGQLIEAKELTGPFILVGHSFGGYNMRYFASKHQDIVAGIVLVESSHPEQFDRMDLKPVKPKKLIRPNSISFTISRPIMHAKYPGEVKTLAYILMTMQKSHRTRMDELEHFEMSAMQVANADPIPDVPLVVLTRGKRVWPLDDRGDKMEAVWEEMQSELSNLSNISIQVIAKNSGHSVHLDQPQLVSSAILNTIGASRKIEQEKLARLALDDDSSISFQQATLYNYFDFPMIGGQVNHAFQTVYYDATAIAADLN